MIRSLRFAWLLPCTLFLSGCATYVNIPAQRGDFARHNPNDRVVQAVLVESLQAVAKTYPVEGSFALILPIDTSVKTYKAVAKKTGEQAVWPGNRDREDLPVLEVKQILIRRQDALVDIVRSFHPKTDQQNDQPLDQVMTVELQWHPLQGWLTQRVRPWNVTVEKAFWVSADETE